MFKVSDKIRGLKFDFYTQAGVFSKSKVDEGTKLLLENIEIKNGDDILDLGCGNGVMGIVISKFSKGKINFVDCDIRSTRLTKKNIELNNVRNSEVVISDGFSDLEGKKFDLIVTYPPSHEGTEIVEEFIRGSREHLKKFGRFYVVTEKRLKNYYQRLFENNYKNVEIMKTSNKHILFLLT